MSYITLKTKTINTTQSTEKNLYGTDLLHYLDFVKEMCVPSRHINASFLICVALFSLGFAKEGPCKTLFNGCCPGKHWDTGMDTCVDCPAGFFAANCSRKCVYPYFGEKCNQTCSCDNTTCSFMNGCNTGNTSQFVSNATHDASEAMSLVYTNNTTLMFILLIIFSSILVVICIPYTAMISTEKYWKRDAERGL